MKEKIMWNSWDKKFFERAKKEGKPILLDISAVWCHWCHQQEKVYENSNIVKMINSNFIPIKVDTDRRPDINDRYNQGGWPTTAILTENGEIITGGLYYPEQQLLTLLQLTKKHYADNKKFLLSKTFNEKINIIEKKSVLNEKIVDEIIGNLTKLVDFEYGGFGFQPKFPIPELIELFISHFKKTNDEKLLKIVAITLDNMIGIYDKLEGGFYRYSVTREWNTPHFEKLLDINTKLVMNYLHAFEVTKNKKYKKIAEGTIKYIEKNLLNKSKPYFYGSQDADEEYYKSTKRKKMKKPSVDKTLFTNLNYSAILAFLEASKILKKIKYKNISLKVIEFLLTECYQNCMCHYYDGKPKNLELLVDQIGMIACLSETYLTTNNKKYLEKTEKLVKYIKRNLMHSSGIFFDKKKNQNDIGYLKQRNIPITDNLLLVGIFAKLFKITKNLDYKKMAEKILIYFSDKHQNYGVNSGLYALAMQRYFELAKN